MEKHVNDFLFDFFKTCKEELLLQGKECDVSDNVFYLFLNEDYHLKVDTVFSKGAFIALPDLAFKHFDRSKIKYLKELKNIPVETVNRKENNWFQITSCFERDEIPEDFLNFLTRLKQEKPLVELSLKRKTVFCKFLITNDYVQEIVIKIAFKN